VLEGELFIGLSDLVLRGTPGDSQDVVGFSH
jgi:hypothetical protein